MAEFGEATEYGAQSKNGESNAKWIGAKFDLDDEQDKAIVAKAQTIQGNMSLKKFIAEMVVYCYQQVKGE